MMQKYDPAAIETKWYEHWENSGYFRPRGDSPDSFCIMIPPPNVTGTLHMGHAFQDTIMDALVRYHRMKGDKTLWQPGTDHAGIATQMVVERQLNAQGLTRHDLGREKFIEKVWEWKEQSGNTITRQLRRLGASCDWSRERFTMDEGLSAAVQEVFEKLYDEGLIYRGKRLVNWDPVLHTALSDLEVISEEENGHLWHLRYPIADANGQPGDEYLVVATTRPETMLGDTAVAVHPEDERYAHLIGKQVALPLTDRTIPVIADEYVDREFGTGCVKITPAHDFNDYEIGKRHDLPLINVLTDDARINDEMPEKYRGLDRFEARKQIVSDLEQQGLLEKIEDHTLMVPRGDRSGAVVEPYLTDQWYVKIQPLADPAIEAVNKGDIAFVPDNWKNTYYSWMNNIQDWCISRQLWWGHRIPAWYNEDGNIYVGKSEAAVREKYDLPENLPLRQDEDVLDTWFSSALWPFSTLGWPQDSEKLNTFYPTNVLVTGFDIIFFWVARMIMMGLKFMDDVPFKEVYVHGLVRDSHGQKMSKSKGNVLDPLDIIDGIDLETLVKKRTSGLMQPQLAPKIEKQTREEFPEGIKPYGCDALRFTFASLASTGRDIKFDMNRLEGYRNFCNKVFNASRFVFMNTEDFSPLANWQPESVAEKWIVSRLQERAETVSDHLENYRLDLAAQSVYDFFWNDYCDWFVELSKPLLNQDDASLRRNVKHTLLHVLDQALRLLHPIMPFITEEIWQEVKTRLHLPDESLMLARFPQKNPALTDPAAEADMQWVQDVILGVRQIRGEMNIAPGKPLTMLLENASPKDLQRLQAHRLTLEKLARLEHIEPLENGAEAPESAMALVGDMKLLIPLAGLIDKQAEMQRLNKLLNGLEKEIQRAQGKLANERFVAKAPAAVVEKEKAKLADARQRAGEIRQQLHKLEQLADA